MLASVSITDVMTPSVETVTPETPAIAAAKRLREREIGSVVVARDGKPVGIVTETDFIDLLVSETDVESVSVTECMSSPLLKIDVTESIEVAARTLRGNDIKRLPVVDGGDLVGIVTTTDLSYYLPRFSLRSPVAGESVSRQARSAPEMAYEEEGWQFDYRDETGNGTFDVGDVVEFSKRLSDEDVRSFAQVSGDTNRLHLDEEFAGQTRFGRRIVHGTLVAGLVSAALARIPGLTIYLSQDVSYLGPVDVGERVSAVCEVTEDLGGEKYRLSTCIYDSDGERVIEGDAVVLIDELPDAADHPAELVE